MKTIFRAFFLLAIAAWSTPGAPAAFAQTSIYKAPIATPATGNQRVALTYRAIFNHTAPISGTVQVSIPFPIDDDAQSVESYSFSSAMTPEKLLLVALKSEAITGNRTLQIQVLDPSPGEQIRLEWIVSRREKSNLLGVPFKANAPIAPADKRFLRPNNILPSKGPIAEMAQNLKEMVGVTSDDTIETIYRNSSVFFYPESSIYKKLVKDARGDSKDASSLATELARATGIPAKAEIGISIPTEQDEGEITGTKSWTNLFHTQRGWVPIDPFEAAQKKSFADYYLGRIGSDRISFSVGDSIEISPVAEKLIISNRSDTTREIVPMKMQLTFKRLLLIERVIKSGEAQKENRSEIPNRDF